MGDRSFSVYASTLWNSLDSEIKNAPCLTTFKNKLKTHYFNMFLKNNHLKNLYLVFIMNF